MQQQKNGLVFQNQQVFAGNFLWLLGSLIDNPPKVFSFEKNSKGKNPPGPLSYITLDSETEELPPRYCPAPISV